MVAGVSHFTFVKKELAIRRVFSLVCVCHRVPENDVKCEHVGGVLGASI